MPFFLGLVTAQWLGVYIAYILLSPENGGFLEDLATVVIVYVAINVATFFFGIARQMARARPRQAGPISALGLLLLPLLAGVAVRAPDAGRAAAGLAR